MGDSLDDIFEKLDEYGPSLVFHIKDLDDNTLFKELSKFSRGAINIIYTIFKSGEDARLSLEKEDSIKVGLRVGISKYHAEGIYDMNRDVSLYDSSGTNIGRILDGPSDQRINLNIKKFGGKYNPKEIEYNHPLKNYCPFAIAGVLKSFIPQIEFHCSRMISRKVDVDYKAYIDITSRDPFKHLK
jgi:hypothetical protein